MFSQMILPNADRALIESAKLTDYLLNLEHKRGGSKAKLLIQCGYSPERWQQLEDDIRSAHLEANVTVVKETDYGIRYEIRTNLLTPVGRVLPVKTVWQFDLGTDFPRLITLVPD